MTQTTTEYGNHTPGQLADLVGYVSRKYRQARGERAAFDRYVALTTLHSVALELNARR